MDFILAYEISNRKSKVSRRYFGGNGELQARKQITSSHTRYSRTHTRYSRMHRYSPTHTRYSRMRNDCTSSSTNQLGTKFKRVVRKFFIFESESYAFQLGNR